MIFQSVYVRVLYKMYFSCNIVFLDCYPITMNLKETVKLNKISYRTHDIWYIIIDIDKKINFSFQRAGHCLFIIWKHTVMQFLKDCVS